MLSGVKRMRASASGIGMCGLLSVCVFFFYSLEVQFRNMCSVAICCVSQNALLICGLISVCRNGCSCFFCAWNVRTLLSFLRSTVLRIYK